MLKLTQKMLVTGPVHYPLPIYDESLAGFGVTTPYVDISWSEMAPSEIGGAIATLAPPRYRKVGLASGGQW